MKKVLFILHLPPPVHGASMIGKYILESKIINSKFNSKYINISTSKKIDEIGKNPLSKIARYFKIIFILIKDLIFFRPQTVYFSITAKGIGFYKDFPIIILIKLFKRKLVIHYHNKGVSKRQNYFLDNILYKILFADVKVILLSKYLYVDIKKYIDEKNIYYCPNGIPLHKTSNKKWNQNKIPKLLYLSNLIESKGIYILLNALKLLKDKGVKFQLNLVGGEGDISSTDLLKKIIYYDIQDCVNYLGKKYNEDKYDIYNNSDIFTFPTFYHNECFPLVILEAMMFGLPVISTCEGAIAEIIDDNETGFLINKRDKVDLANKIQQLIENPSLRKSMGRKGKEKFEREYTLSHFEKNMTEILTKIN